MSVQVKGSGTIGGLDEGLVVSGIVTSSTQINVGSNIKLGNAGVITATSFVGDGSGLTGTGPSLTGSTNNTIVTVTGANALQGESNLTYDGNTLQVATDTNMEGIKITSSGNTYNDIQISANRSGSDNHIGRILGQWNGQNVAAIIFNTGGDTSGKDDGEILLATSGGGANPTERLRITQSGNVNIGGDYSQSSRTLAVNGSVLFKATEADIWMESTGPNGVWRILGSTGTNTHRFRIYDNTNNSDRFNIDSNGYIYEPAMPFGVLHGSTGWEYNNNGSGHYLLGNTNSSSGGGNGSDKQLNLGWTTSGGNGATNNNFTPSNGIWTAPIAGYYVFGLKLYGLMNGSDYIQIKPCLNGTHLSETIYGYQQGNGTYMEGINETVRYYMNANDTFSWNAYGPNNAWRIYGAHCETSGYLVRGT